MTSKAQRRGRKRAKAHVNLANEPAKRSNRYPSGDSRPEDPRKTALQARCRISGIPDPKEAARALLGTQMGLCINALANGDLPELTEAWQAISASHRNFRLLIIGQTGNPQGASIAMVPDPVETDPSLRVELRTHEERVEAAKRSWAAWEARIKALPFGLKWIMEGVLFGFMGEAILWKDQKPTEKGRLAVEALRRVMR